MTETILDSNSIGPGNSVTASFGMGLNDDVASFILRGDSNSSNVDVDVTGVAFQPSDTVVGAHSSAVDSVTGLDATTDANNNKAFSLSNLKGFAHVEVKVTNQAASSTTITLEEY